VPEDALNHWRKAIERGKNRREGINSLLTTKRNIPKKLTLDRMHEAELPEGWDRFHPPTPQKIRYL